MWFGGHQARHCCAVTRAGVKPCAAAYSCSAWIHCSARLAQCRRVQIDGHRKSVPVPVDRDDGAAFAVPAEKRVAGRIRHDLAVVCRVLRTAASNWAHKSLYSCSVIQCLATACFRSCTRSYCQEGGICPSRTISISVRTSSSRLSRITLRCVSVIAVSTPIVFILFYCYYTTTKCVVKMTSHCLAGSGTLTYGHGPLPILAVQKPQLCKIVVRATLSTCREAIILIKLL